MSARKAKWQNDYIAKAYDRINLTVPKGEKESIQTAAQKTGESVNGFIWRLIQAELDRLGVERAAARGFGNADGGSGQE